MRREDQYMIKEQVFEVLTPNASGAHSLQQQIEQIYYERVVQKMENICHELAPDGMCYEIERLELDVGRCDRERLPDELPEKIEAAFREALSNALISSQVELPVIQPPPGTVLNVQSELLFYFLKNGQVPWWYSGETDHISWEQVIESAVEENRSDWQDTLSALLRDSTIRKRIIWQFTPAAMIKMLSPLNSGAEMAYSLWQAVSKIPSPNVSEGIFWNEVLQQAGRVSSGDELVCNLVGSTAELIGQPYDRFVRSMIRKSGVERRSGTSSGVSSILTILEEELKSERKLKRLSKRIKPFLIDEPPDRSGGERNRTRHLKTDLLRSLGEDHIRYRFVASTDDETVSEIYSLIFGKPGIINEDLEFLLKILAEHDKKLGLSYVDFRNYIWHEVWRHQSFCMDTGKDEDLEAVDLLHKLSVSFGLSFSDIIHQIMASGTQAGTRHQNAESVLSMLQEQVHIAQPGVDDQSVNEGDLLQEIAQALMHGDEKRLVRNLIQFDQHWEKAIDNVPVGHAEYFRKIIRGQDLDMLVAHLDDHKIATLIHKIYHRVDLKTIQGISNLAAIYTQNKIGDFPGYRLRNQLWMALIYVLREDEKRSIEEILVTLYQQLGSRLRIAPEALISETLKIAKSSSTGNPQVPEWLAQISKIGLVQSSGGLGSTIDPEKPAVDTIRHSSISKIGEKEDIQTDPEGKVETTGFSGDNAESKFGNDFSENIEGSDRTSVDIPAKDAFNEDDQDPKIIKQPEHKTNTGPDGTSGEKDGKLFESSGAGSETVGKQESPEETSEIQIEKRTLDSGSYNRETHQTIPDFWDQEDKESLGFEVYIRNAGLVVLGPFLPGYFKQVELLDDHQQFLNEDSIHQGVHLLQWMVTTEHNSPEYLLPLNKLLCGIDPLSPVPQQVTLDEHAVKEANELLETVIKHWSALKNTSVDGFREAFLRREGRMIKSSDRWTIQVEQRSYDILLEQIPWSIYQVSVPWLDQTITVEWH